VNRVAGSVAGNSFRKRAPADICLVHDSLHADPNTSGGSAKAAASSLYRSSRAVVMFIHRTGGSVGSG
jgi:hypothetical protein